MLIQLSCRVYRCPIFVCLYMPKYFFFLFLLLFKGFRNILIKISSFSNNRGVANGKEGGGGGGAGVPCPPTSIFELNMFLKFQFRTSGILLFTDVQKLYGLEILQFLLCICGQFMDYLWTIFG